MFIGTGVFFLIFLVIIYSQIFQAYRVKQVLTNRIKLIENREGEDVVVPEISKEMIPFAFNFTDISADTSYWVNRCYASHYHLKTVRTGLQVSASEENYKNFN
jgi:hypothetical protein